MREWCCEVRFSTSSQPDKNLYVCVYNVLQIKWGACGLVLAGNTVVFVTILLFFYFFGHDDSFEYSTW